MTREEDARGTRSRKARPRSSRIRRAAGTGAPPHDEEVPKADVVITNPTHYAVALRYEDGRMRAPVLVAKGADEVAARIRELAAEHGVPLVSRRRRWRARCSATSISASRSRPRSMSRWPRC
jgi:flagellar biosynthetic protein FlhB